jgi:hypothetical protein
MLNITGDEEGRERFFDSRNPVFAAVLAVAIGRLIAS